jgi:hypothetical protein
MAEPTTARTHNDDTAVVARRRHNGVSGTPLQAT